MHDLAAQRLHFSVGKYGRVANSITNMARPIRPALQHTGQRLVTIDIRCCQPSLLGQLVLSAARRNTRHSEQDEGRTTDTTIYDSQKQPQNHPLEPGVLEPGDVVANPCEPANLQSGGHAANLQTLGGSDCLRNYSELTQSGELYDYMLDRLDGMSRDELKQRLLADVFAKRKANRFGAEYPSPVEDCFRELFPEVYRFIRMVNKDGFEHCNLIRELQRAESDLVIGQVCESLRVRYPLMFVITLHDAIYTTEKNIPLVVQEFERAFDVNGFSMALKIGE